TSAARPRRQAPVRRRIRLGPGSRPSAGRIGSALDVAWPSLRQDGFQLHSTEIEPGTARCGESTVHRAQRAMQRAQAPSRTDGTKWGTYANRELSKKNNE